MQGYCETICDGVMKAQNDNHWSRNPRNKTVSNSDFVEIA